MCPGGYMNLCKCGCGQEANFGDWVKGHWMLGKKPWNAGLKNCVSKESLKKMSESHKGENNYWYGKHHSEETKRKIKERDSLTIKEKYKTKWGLKIKNILSKKNSGSGNPMYGHKYSEETLDKMSIIAKNRKYSLETRKKISENTKVSA